MIEKVKMLQEDTCTKKYIYMYIYSVCSGKIDWPRHIDPVAKDLIKKLLVQEQ